MTWIKFICWLSGLYAFYYIGNILWDLSRSKKLAGTESPQLVFEEQVPQKVAADAPPPKLPEKAKSPVVDSGGVRLKQLFQLAKAESIVYTGAVSY